MKLLFFFFHFHQDFCILSTIFPQLLNWKLKVFKIRKMLLLWKNCMGQIQCNSTAFEARQRARLIRPNVTDTVLPQRIKIPPLLFKTLSTGLLRCTTWGYHIRGGRRRGWHEQRKWWWWCKCCARPGKRPSLATAGGLAQRVRSVLRDAKWNP